MTPSSPSDVRRWRERFDAVEAIHRAERAHPLPAGESIRLSLSLIDAMWEAFGGRVPDDPIGERENQEVRERWAKLRAAHSAARGRSRPE